MSRSEPLSVPEPVAARFRSRGGPLFLVHEAAPGGEGEQP